MNGSGASPGESAAAGGAAAGRLRPGTAEEAGLDPGALAALVPSVAAFLAGPEPAFAGFVVLAARHGVVAVHAAGGDAVRYAERGGQVVELPAAERVPMTPDTVFDVASLSKLFTTLVVVRLAERGVLALDASISRWLPGFPALSVRSLLTHTGGWPAEIALGRYPDRAARLAAVGAQPPEYPPGSGYRYSDLGPIALGALVERAAGAPLDALVAELVTGPLGMADTGYLPSAALRERCAATEYQPWTGRGMLRGLVHDENAHYLGGVAGHAGVFSTAGDLAVLGQTLLNGGAYDGRRLLGEGWVAEMLRHQHPELGAAAARGLGWQLDQPAIMGELASPTAFGHGGYTGTSLVADPATGALLVLLTNRVHPSRDRGTDGAYRRAAAAALARAVRAGR
ncbi:serine hydrolase domain-containing protein [Streptomyces sp. DSM 44915]|uniref:Serine hydrolase domain-containing protein n=1 Tax=Streptomyces chisholmiae TaxID=3075540 RepID=A0ABU2JZC7_9ACTN|nr:serine hydrolase domain-containing protein [Streptomyces sp. DSM 44915]MDT0270355.1 serine hydrolase domain-containing protein [Streptomyces sp. DSM 44915]